MDTKKIRVKKYFAPQNEGVAHVCDFPGCTKKGEYRAPKDKLLNSYYWFCLEHVQAYNAKWDYYDTPFEEDFSSAPHMHFGGFSSKIKYQFGYDFIDELGFQSRSKNFYDSKKARFTGFECSCAEVLEIDLENIDLLTLKKQYKKLARRYHPDLNGGDKACEEKFKKITQAYESLLKKIKTL